MRRFVLLFVTGAATAVLAVAAAQEAADAAQEAAEAAAETAAAAVAAAEEAADAAQEAAESAAMAAEDDEAVGHVPTGEIRTPVTLFSGTEGATGTSGTDHAMLWTIYDTLVAYDKDNVPQPARSLAQSWEIPDPLNVIFNMRVRTCSSTTARRSTRRRCDSGLSAARRYRSRSSRATSAPWGVSKRPTR